MTVQAAEYKQKVGLDSLYIAQITQDDASGYVTDTPQYLAPVATAKATPKVDTAVSYFDDQAFDTLDAEGATEIEIEISNLPAETQALILGQEFDAVTGRVMDDADPAQAPYFALGFRSKKTNGSYRYTWYNKVRFSRPDEEYSTQTDKAEAKSTTLKASALKTIYKFTYPSTEVKGCKRVWGDEDTDAFSATGWFTTVQTPVTTSAPSLTCTPTPTGTGVAVGVNVTLTFSNKIATGNAGIVITKAGDGSIVAGAYSWDTAVKVLTFNPTSDLTAANVYHITLSGVRDIYGQTFANTVYSFTTA
jgi:phi13 family phage major tail protein